MIRRRFQKREPAPFIESEQPHAEADRKDIGAHSTKPGGNEMPKFVHGHQHSDHDNEIKDLI